MNYKKYLTLLIVPLFSQWTWAEPNGEAREISHEQLDAAYTEADARRDAAKWSDEVIVHKTPDPIGDMSAEADLIIQATVTSQSNSHNTRGIPLTHTTFAISDVVKGDYLADEITITQEGGPSKKNSSKVVMMSHTKYFSVGDEELLFLELDPDNALPENQIMVKQRYGVHQGKIFDENGRGLIYSPSDNAVGYSLAMSQDRNPHPRFRDFQIGSHKFSKKFGEDNDDADYGGDSQSQASLPGNRGHQRSMDVAAFRAAIKR